MTICERKKDEGVRSDNMRERERQRERESNDRDGERDAARKEKRNTNKNQPPRKKCVDQKKLGDRIPKQLWRQRRRERERERESAKRDNKTVKAKGPPTKKHLRVLIPIKQTLA